MKTIKLLTILLILISNVFSYNDVCKYDKSYLPYYQKMNNIANVDTIYNGKDTNYFYETVPPILESDTAIDKSQVFFDIGLDKSNIWGRHLKNVAYNDQHNLYIRVNPICGLSPSFVAYTIEYDNKIHKDTLFGDNLIGIHKIDFKHGLYNYSILSSASVIALDKISNKIDTVYNLKNLQYIKNFKNVSIDKVNENNKRFSFAKNKRDYLGRINFRKGK